MNTIKAKKYSTCKKTRCTSFTLLPVLALTLFLVSSPVLAQPVNDQTSGTETQNTSEATEDFSSDESRNDTVPETSDNSQEEAAGQTDEGESASALVVTGQDVADFACRYVGGPYVWGGVSLTGGADCSGFVMSVYANFGINLPHYAASQAGYGTPVEYDRLQPGDLIFYGWEGEISHVAIYIGDGNVVHAQNEANGICITPADYQPAACCRRLI